MAASGRKVIGMDLGGTKLLAGAIDERVGVHMSAYRVVDQLDQKQLLIAIGDAVEEIREKCPDVEAVGFGIPCLIDQISGVAVMSVNLPLSDLPFRDIMSERLGGCRSSSTTTPMSPPWWRQRHGAAQGSDHVVGLTIGTGIGGGMVLDGRVYRGSVGAAGELGHMVVDEDGPPCQGNCPNRGCLEAVASGRAIGPRGAGRGAAGARLGARRGARGRPRDHGPVRDRPRPRGRRAGTHGDRPDRAQARRRGARTQPTSSTPR